MAEIAIVSMTREHLPAVIALWQATEGLVLSDADHPEPLKRYLDCHPGISQVALGEGSVVGAVLCGHDGRRGYLYHLAVARDFRKRGIGRRLVDASLEKLVEAGFSRCNLFVLDDNDEGKAFWWSDGWYEWPEIRLMSKDVRSGHA